MPQVRLANGNSFAATSDICVLDAALAAGMVLEHSCRSGRCGTCRARALEGTVAPIMHDLFLTEAQRAAGWMLTCVDGAGSDLQLDIEDIGLPPHIQVRTLPCRIDELARPAPDVLIVRLRLPPRSAFRYLPGQYINVIANGGLRRSYSIANSLGEPDRLELHVRRIDDGALSRYWFHDARVNDLLRIRGPLGTFFLRDVAGIHLVLLATGTGIAPVKAMLADLAHRTAAAQPRMISLLWGNRGEADLYWSPSRTQLAHLTYVPVLSRADTSWRGAVGHVQDVLLARHADWTDTTVYACGSPTMIKEARVELGVAGLPERRFVSDAFVPSE